MHFDYNSKLTGYSRELRNNSTLSEALLWNQLKNRKLLGFKFRRQKPIKNFIVDFFCFELMLAVEIDGSTHYENQDYDAFRERELKNLGIRFLRFGDMQIKKNINSVLIEIEEWIKDNR